MALDRELHLLADDKLDELVERKLAMLAKANALVDEDKSLVDQLAAQLAEAEVNDASVATITELQRQLDARTAHGCAVDMQSGTYVQRVTVRDGVAGANTTLDSKFEVVQQ